MAQEEELRIKKEAEEAIKRQNEKKEQELLLRSQEKAKK